MARCKQRHSDQEIQNQPLCAGFAADGTDGSGAKLVQFAGVCLLKRFLKIVTAFLLVCLAFLFVCVLLCEQTTEKYMNTRERCVLGITRTHTTQEQNLSPARGCVLLNLSMDGNTSRHHSRHESRGKRQRASAAGAWSMHQLRAAARPWPKKRSSFPWHALSLASLPCVELRLLPAVKLNWS